MADGQVQDGRRVRMDPEWASALRDALRLPEIAELRDFLRARIAEGAEIQPPPPDYFTALDLTPLSRVRVVIIGQDPYHGPGQATGLAFSVRQGVRIPPALHNIHKELGSDLGIPLPSHGCLEQWARSGVLLLNAVLTVEAGKPDSHKGKGWEVLTDAVLRAVVTAGRPCVFLLWGKHAQRKMEGIVLDPKVHRLLTTSHPAPYSAHSGFLGSRPFGTTNAFLTSVGAAPIDWTLG